MKSDQIHITHLIEISSDIRLNLAISSLNANLIDGLLSSSDFNRICYFCCQQPENEFDSAISSFESQPIKLVSSRSQDIISHTIPASHQILAKSKKSKCQLSCHHQSIEDKRTNSNLNSKSELLKSKSLLLLSLEDIISMRETIT
jgi:hypothetical protein